MESTSEWPVSWQNVFLGVLLLAVNTLLQDPGVMLARPGDAGVIRKVPDRILRLSPLVCLVDSLEITSKIVGHLKMGHSLGWASLCILHQRGLVQRHRTEPKQRNHRIRALRLMVGLFGIIQLAKLYGTQGIPLTTATGFCYFYSWVMMEVLDGVADGIPEEHRMEWVRLLQNNDRSATAVQEQDSSGNTVDDDTVKLPPLPDGLGLYKSPLVAAAAALGLAWLAWAYCDLVMAEWAAVHELLAPKDGGDKDGGWTSVWLIYTSLAMAPVWLVVSSAAEVPTWLAAVPVVPLLASLATKATLSLVMSSVSSSGSSLNGDWLSASTTLEATAPFVASVLAVSASLVWALTLLVAAWHANRALFFIPLGPPSSSGPSPPGPSPGLSFARLAWTAAALAALAVAGLHYALRQDFAETRRAGWAEGLC